MNEDAGSERLLCAYFIPFFLGASLLSTGCFGWFGSTAALGYGRGPSVASARPSPSSWTVHVFQSKMRQFGCIIFFCGLPMGGGGKRTEVAQSCTSFGGRHCGLARAVGVCVCTLERGGPPWRSPSPSLPAQRKGRKKATKASEPRTGLDGICVVGPPLERDGVVDRCARKYGQAGQAVARNQNGNELAPQWHGQMAGVHNSPRCRSSGVSLL